MMMTMLTISEIASTTPSAITAGNSFLPSTPLTSVTLHDKRLARIHQSQTTSLTETRICNVPSTNITYIIRIHALLHYTYDKWPWLWPLTSWVKKLGDKNLQFSDIRDHGAQNLIFAPKFLPQRTKMGVFSSKFYILVTGENSPTRKFFSTGYNLGSKCPHFSLPRSHCFSQPKTELVCVCSMLRRQSIDANQRYREHNVTWADNKNIQGA